MEIGGLFLCTDGQQAAIVLILSTDVYTAHKVKTLNSAFDTRKTLIFHLMCFLLFLLGGCYWVSSFQPVALFSLSSGVGASFMNYSQTSLHILSD